MNFRTPVLNRHIGKNRIVLCEPLAYPSLAYGIITVPAGFISDGASIPWSLSWLFPRFGPYLNAAVLHDYLYWAQPYSRRASDWLFYEAMADLNIKLWRRRAIFLGVAAFGWLGWLLNQRKRKSGQIRIVTITHANWHEQAVEMIS